MAQETRRVVFGDTSLFALDFRELNRTPDEVRGLGWGALYLWLNGTRVWGAEDSKGLKAARWTWLDLVEWMARAWPYLLFEEVAPFGLVARTPADLRQKKHLQGVTGKTEDEVEDAVHAYQQRHDMAAGLKGIYMPPVWLLPEGNLMRIGAPKNEVSVPKEWALEQLELFAERILELCEEDQTGRARRARNLWNNRRPTDDRAVEIGTEFTT